MSKAASHSVFSEGWKQPAAVVTQAEAGVAAASVSAGGRLPDGEGLLGVDETNQVSARFTSGLWAIES